MMKNKILITTHSLSEAITHCVLKNQADFNVPITIVSLEELMTEYSIFDELNDEGVSIRWRSNEDIYITNQNHILLNRVLYIPETLFSEFVLEDKEYAQREFEAYLGFSFNAFDGIANQSPKGGVGDVLSLPQQWKHLKTDYQLNVPNFYWGPTGGNDLKNKDNVVYSNIYNFLNWSISGNDNKDSDPIFCFEKPKGYPVFILSMGGARLITTDVAMGADVIKKLTIIINQLNEQFKIFIYELLVFIDGDEINFGCINHEIIRSCKNPMFDKFVCHNLINEFYKCLN